MNIYKVLPDLSRSRHMAIWHKALRSQWSAVDLNWDRPQRITDGRLKDQLARVLTPVLMGEQAALYSVSGVIPILGRHSEVESQFYLTTWAVDEARHTELFARFYGRIDREPLSIRKFPSSYLFQSAIPSRDPAEWLAGVLVSEVLAKRVMHELVRIDLDPVLSEIADGILTDEARHLGFNHIYLEDRFQELFAEDRDKAEGYARQLHEKQDRVLSLAPPVFDAVAAELAELTIDAEALFQGMSEEARERLETSIRRGEKLAAAEPAAAA